MHTAIAWFARNSVAANLLMWILLLMGTMALLTVNQQTFPNMDPEVVTVAVPYLGAAPEEVEAGVCIRIEEAVRAIDGIDKLRSSAMEGSCGVTIELTEGADPIQALNEIKSQVDSIITFPAETEKPIVSKFTMRGGVVQVVLYGNTDERTLKELGKQVRDDIAALPGVSQAHLNYVRPYEISIEVPENNLRRHGLTLVEIRNAVRRTSLDMPGGTIKSRGGEILLRAKGQAYLGEEFEDIVVLTRSDGTKLHIDEIGTVVDGFAEGDLLARFNGYPAVVIQVQRVGKEDTIGIAETVKAYMDDLRSDLPAGIQVASWWDESIMLRDRVDNLVSTAATGLALVLLILALFLRFRLAMWVAAGIPIAMMGAIGLFLFGDSNINILTIMAFILVLGIVVDDAIVVGERVYAHEQEGKSPVVAAIEGTWEVSVPVIFGVLTTIAAFLPLILSSGRMSQVFGTIGWVVIFSLIFSIIESQLILPAHLAHRNHDKSHGKLGMRWTAIQDRLSNWMSDLAQNKYQPLLARALSYRYLTVAFGLAALILVYGMIASGRITFSFFPPVEGDIVFATLEMPEGTAIEVTSAAVQQLERSAEVLRREFDEGLAEGEPSRVKNFLSVLGMHLQKGPRPVVFSAGKSHLGEVALELIPLRLRDNLSAVAVGDRWRELTGGIPDAVKLTFTSAIFTAGNALDFKLTGKDVDQLREAAAGVRAELSRFGGVYDISDSFRSGKQEIKLSLLPQARNWGITLHDLAEQVRWAFYGAEAQRIQRGADEVRVMVRYPEDERRSIGNLEDMRIRTADGTEVPFTSVATFDIGRGFSTINRFNGRRVVNVFAEVDRNVANPERIMSSMLRDVMPGIKARFPGVTAALDGEQEERGEALSKLALGALLSLAVIYALLAIPLRSYLQPLVIMSVIPFGAVGAMVGHYIMGVQLMFFSLLGIIALAGVVVNASLVLVDYTNRQRREGISLIDAVSRAGVVRFRPIILTSVTTFMGLLPLLLRADPSTAFIVPMAISLAFGILFATVITLIFVPCLYLIAEDFFPWGELDRETEQGEQEIEAAHVLS